MLLEVGKTVEGKISGITPFGAFIDLGEGKTGLVHISEVALEYVKDINEHLKEGETVSVKVVSIDDKGKISLSIKQALLDKRKSENQARKQRVSRPDDFDWSSNKTSDTPMSFEEMMNKFKQSSDERMHDIKKGVDSKRGGNYRRSSGSY
ncbi:MAG: S1 RNA-binding domain-containing protein [Clostridia bacterium]|nr:S1 RNA-binding domain-containing protein [Clostridia bacterium]